MVECRRRWRLEVKLRIVAEAEAPGARFAEVARRHDVSRGVLWNWRRQVRTGALGPAGAFLPVRIMPEQTASNVSAPPAVPSRQQAAGKDTTIEIALPGATTVRVGRDVGAVALRPVLGASRG